MKQGGKIKMGNGQIGYDISPYEALDEISKQYPKDEKLGSICKGLKDYIKHLEKSIRKKN